MSKLVLKSDYVIDSETYERLKAKLDFLPKEVPPGSYFTMIQGAAPELNHDYYALYPWPALNLEQKLDFEFLTAKEWIRLI